jgi:DNA-binding CsgD family transcriptional regulator
MSPIDDLEVYRPILNGLGAALERLSSVECPPALAAVLETAGEYDSTVFAAFPETGRPIRLYSNLPAHEEETTLRPYFDNTYLLDPWYNMARSRVPDGVYRLSDNVPDSFQESEYFLSYYAATNLIDECGIFARLSDTMCVVGMLGIRSREPTGRRGRLDRLNVMLPCVREIIRRQWAGIASLTPTPMENLHSLCAAKGLVGREVEVTEHLLRGFSNKMIARELGISPETVKVYRKRINRKLGTSSTREVFAIFFGRND